MQASEFKNIMRQLMVQDLPLALQTTVKQIHETSPKARQALLLNAQYADMQKDKIAGVIENRDIDLKTNQIRSNLLTLTESVTDADFSPATTGSMPTIAAVPKFVVVYAQEDQKYCDLLNKHLSVLKITKKIAVYNVNEAEGGENTLERAQEEWGNADYMLALITVNLFSAPDWFGMVYDALGAGRRVIPVRIKRADYEGTGLEKLHSLPSQNRAVSDFPNEDEAYSDIVSGIRRLLPK